MDVIICGIKMVPSCEGGIERGVEETCSRLASKGYNITIYCRGIPFQEDLYNGCKIIRIPYFNSKYLCYFTHMAKVFLHIVNNQSRSTLIHVHTPAVNGIWIAFLRLRGHPVVVHNHGLEWRASKWPYWFKITMKISVSIGVRAASRLICVSNEERFYFCRKHPKITKQCDVIPNGLPDGSSNVSSTLFENLNLQDKEYYVYVGRLVPQKRVEDLIQAYKISGSKKLLIVVGGASYSDSYAQSLYRLSDECSGVIFTGWCERTDVLQLLEKAYSFILPSESEGCPNALLEAISCHCVCVVSDIAAHREIGGDNLIYFNVKDRQSLANIISSLESDDGIFTEARCSIKSLSKKLATWDQIASRVASVYDSVTRVTT